jgi:hypothetical protein
LKQNAVLAGKTGADIYRPTIGFAGAMIFVGGIILIVFRGLNIIILMGRAPKYGCKIRGMAKVGGIGYGKRRDRLGKSMRPGQGCLQSFEGWTVCTKFGGGISQFARDIVPFALHEIS